MQELDYSCAEAGDWIAVDAYFADLLAPDDPVLTAVLKANAEAGLPPHDVSALQGRMLALLAQVAGAKRLLEIGTLGGYSTIHMARAIVPDGLILTIEADERHAAVAHQNFKRAGLETRIDLRIGQARDVLATLEGPFDFIFIDADKPNNPAYLDLALELSRPGTLIIGDNVVRGGAVVNPESSDLNVQGVRSFLELIAAEPRLTATAIQTVGMKGWDGFVLARFTGE